MTTFNITSPTTYLISQPLNFDIGYGTGSISGLITLYPPTPQFGSGIVWDLTVTVGSLSHEFTNLNSGIIKGASGLVANPDTLQFDFANSSFFFSQGANTGYIVGWASGCNLGEYCGLAEVGLGYSPSGPLIAAWSQPYGGTLATIGYTPISVPGPTVGENIFALITFPLLITYWWWNRRMSKR